MLSLLKKHFPHSCWKKHYSKLVFSVLSVFYGVKPSLLWDFGPRITANQISSFVSELKLLLQNISHVLIVVIESDILLVNSTYCLKTLPLERVIIQIHRDHCKLINSKENIYICGAIKLLIDKFSNCDECKIWCLSSDEVFCAPSLFGLLLHYPVVYSFSGEYQPFSVALKVFSVNCQFSYENLQEDFELFSFSIPENLITPEIDNFIIKWFNSLKTPDNIVFKNLRLNSRCHLLKEAAHYFAKCLTLKPSYIQAQHNLDILFNLAVERWHFRMLNDGHRNQSFRKAIIAKINQGFDKVLDIGTGTGLLSLFCVEGKAREIYACDSSDIMIDAAKSVFRRNNATNVKLIHKHSTELLIPSDIPKRISLVVTEIFDSGLLGEGILSTLNHAWKNLLLPPCHHEDTNFRSKEHGFVIPLAASVYAVGIESDSVSRRFYVNFNENLFHLDKFNAVSLCDDYDSQDLALIDFKFVTNVQKLLYIDFNDPVAIGNILSGSCTHEFKLKCTNSGRLDCFAVWFDLILDDDLVLNTGPESETNSAWQQAIFPIPKNFFLSEGDDVGILLTLANDKLSLNLVEVVPETNFKVSEALVSILNDSELIKSIVESQEKFQSAFDRPIRIMDWFPFPIFGINYLMARRKLFKDQLTCIVSSEADQIFVNFLAEKYGIKDLIVVEVEKNLDDFFFRKKKFDLIVLNVIDTRGMIYEKCASNILNIRKLLKPNGIILPEEITAVGQFVNSDWLRKVSRVLNDELTCGFHVSEFINIYQARHFADLGVSFKKTSLSKPVNLFSVWGVDTAFEVDIPCILCSMPINALVYWFKVKFTKDSALVFTNRRNSAYNQSAFLFDDVKFTSSDKISCRVLRSEGLFSIQLLVNDEIAS